MNKGLNVLSLFDGMGCSYQALTRAGFKVDNYFASEVDKHAIKVTSTKIPGIIHLGDVTKVTAKSFGELRIDLICAGSPC